MGNKVTMIPFTHDEVRIVRTTTAETSCKDDILAMFVFEYFSLPENSWMIETTEMGTTVDTVIYLKLG